MANLKIGSRGPDVTMLQNRLRALGFDPGASDGDFGPATQSAVMTFQTSHGLLPDGIVGPLTAAALASQQPGAAPTALAFPGFDTSLYPGDSQMDTWKRTSPYVFAGYYLKSPCHPDASWMGHRAQLVGVGWNLLPIYVGQQVAGVSRCTKSDLTATAGAADALDAGAKLTSEGFPSGSYVYLDVERSDSFPAGLADYISAWVSTITAGGIGPGIYCHLHNANDVRAAVLAALPSTVLPPRFWIVGGVTSQFNLATSRPADVGVPFADVWQCPASVSRTFGGDTINIDEDVSQLSDPAGTNVRPAVAGQAT